MKLFCNWVYNTFYSILKNKEILKVNVCIFCVWSEYIKNNGEKEEKSKKDKFVFLLRLLKS